MQEHEIRCCLSLLALPGAGASSVLRLLRRAGSAAAALRLDGDALRALELRIDTIEALRGLRGEPAPDTTAAADWLLRHAIHVLSVNCAEYPPLLETIACPPPVLFVQGNLAALSWPQIALVGSRRPTASGRECAFTLAGELAKCGLAITSGLAIGIDTAGHQGALAVQGCSLAVMGTGPDRVYPTRNLALAREIVAGGGALLSEFVPGTGAEAANFPRRNRIISGLSLGVLVVEAALPSGSLLTARYASEQDREVMAVPGPIRSAVSRGCHELLRQGAALVENAADVLAALGDRFRPHTAASSSVLNAGPAPGSLGADEQAVFDATGFEDTPLDLLIQRSGLGAARAGAAAVRLELRGLIVGRSGGYQRNS